MRDDHSYIVTYTGRKFWPLDPKPEDIDIRDIAHALSMQCRFGGHAKRFYSVAQHSLFVSFRVPVYDKLWALLHDAAEAYLVDVPRPVKHQPEMQPYRDAEAAIMRCVCQAFGLPFEEPASVKEADRRMVLTEAREITGWDAETTATWSCLGEPYQDMVLKTLAPSYAEVSFLQAFDEYMNNRLIAA